MATPQFEIDISTELRRRAERRSEVPPDLFDADFPAPESYRWADGLQKVGLEVHLGDGVKPGRWLTNGISVFEQRSYGTRWVRPFRERKYEAVYREFASLPGPLAEADVVAFANTYGSLGRKFRRVVAIPPGARFDDGLGWQQSPQAFWGEPFEDWVREQVDLYFCVRLWDAYVAGGEQRAQLYSGDLSTRVIHLIEQDINEHLRENTHATIEHDASGKPGSIKLQASNLVGLMWLQFAWAVNGERIYRECKRCRRWMAIAPEASRRDRLFCTPSCKAAWHRENPKPKKQRGKGKRRAKAPRAR